MELAAQFGSRHLYVRAKSAAYDVFYLSYDLLDH